MKEYVASEQFIYDDLLLRSNAVLEGLRKKWNRITTRSADKQELFVMGWPEKSLRTADGRNISLLMHEIKDETKASSAVQAFVKKFNIYAFLLVTVRPTHVSALFESHRGTRAWLFEAVYQGDRYKLVDPKITDNEEGLGVLRAKKKKTREN